MHPCDAIRSMVSACGKTLEGVSLETGSCRSRLTSMLARRAYPRTDVLVRCAESCGWRLELVSEDGSRIVLDAEEECGD